MRGRQATLAVQILELLREAMDARDPATVERCAKTVERFGRTCRKPLDKHMAKDIAARIRALTTQ